MSKLQDEMLKVLQKHGDGLSVDDMQAELQRAGLNVPQWVISFELASLQVKGLTTKRGDLWSLKWRATSA